MPDQTQTDGQPGVTTLVSGIVQDAQELMRQQFKLFQVEVKNDLRRTKEATIPMFLGAMVAFIGVLALAMAGGFLLNWLWPNMPTWGGFAIVGGALALVGAILVFAGKSRFDSFNPLPDETVEGLKENLQWKTKR